jgi:aminoglycoside phosphotransferase (APT) family kinase protein
VNAWVHKDRLLTVAESAQWRHLETTSAGRPLMSRLRGLRTRSVRSVVWHGDLAPWNIRVNRRTGRCVVLDWERSQWVGLPGWDWFHFTIQTGALFDRLSAPGLRAKLERLLASDAFSAYAKRCGIRGLERQLVLAYLLYRIEVLGVTDDREHLRALLGLLAEAWTADSNP